MDRIPERLEINAIPVHVTSWAVAKVPGFVPAILRRWHRSHADLPECFELVMCPVAELNACGGIPARVHELTDPRLTCRHFTGCSRPYYAMIFTGSDADLRRAEIQSLLPWSEAYAIDIDNDTVHMTFIEATEDVELSQSVTPVRSIADLLESGELLKIM